ncbi:MAG: hypothetical protein O3C58_06585, partial [Nitrospinae bacterium]|nr:hypothetical protein [Nitrospinota bacterium]
MKDYVILKEVFSILLGESRVSEIETALKQGEFPPKVGGVLRETTSSEIYSIILEAVLKDEILNLNIFEIEDHIETNLLDILIFRWSFIQWFKDNPEKKNHIETSLKFIGREFPLGWVDPVESSEPEKDKAQASAKIPKPDSQQGAQEATVFINKLRVWRVSSENTTEIAIQERNKQHRTYGYSAFGFANIESDQWKNFLSMLNDGSFSYGKKDTIKKNSWRE